MSKPNALPIFGTAQTNQAVPSGGLQTNGYANGDIPSAVNLNYLLNLIYLWIAWLFGNVATITRNTFPPILGTATGWAYGTFGSPTFAAYLNTAAGTLTAALDVPQGFKLSTLKFGLVGDTASPGGSPNSLTVVLNSVRTNAQVAPTVLSTYIVVNGSVPTVVTDQTLNFLATTNLVASVTVAAAGGTYTRTTGSFLTDGFWVGQQIQWSGFTNSGNNAVKTITALTATVMTVSTTGLVNETGIAIATCNGVSPTIDDTFAMQLALTGAAVTHTIAVGILRYTCIPQ